MMLDNKSTKESLQEFCSSMNEVAKVLSKLYSFMINNLNGYIRTDHPRKRLVLYRQKLLEQLKIFDLIMSFINLLQVMEQNENNLDLNLQENIFPTCNTLYDALFKTLALHTISVERLFMKIKNFPKYVKNKF